MRISEVPVPTRYFAQASSASFLASSPLRPLHPVAAAALCAASRRPRPSESIRQSGAALPQRRGRQYPGPLIWSLCRSFPQGGNPVGFLPRVSLYRDPDSPLFKAEFEDKWPPSKAPSFPTRVSSRALAASAMAAAVVHRHALRLHLSARAALRHRGHLMLTGFLPVKAYHFYVSFFYGSESRECIY